MGTDCLHCQSQRRADGSQAQVDTQSTIRWGARRFVVVDYVGLDAVIAREVGKRKLERIPVRVANPDRTRGDRAAWTPDLVSIPEGAWEGAVKRFTGRKIEYRVIRSQAARKLRVRVGPNGVEVLQPAKREDGDVTAFLRANGEWISGQLSRVARLNGVRKPERRHAGQLLYRGVPTPVQVETDDRRRGVNCVLFENGCIRLTCGPRTPPTRTLENWLRRQARAEIERYLRAVTKRLRRSPRKLYIMDQRTKWGNCSAMQNLSFALS